MLSEANARVETSSCTMGRGRCSESAMKLSPRELHLLCTNSSSVRKFLMLGLRRSQSLSGRATSSRRMHTFYLSEKIFKVVSNGIISPEKRVLLLQYSMAVRENRTGSISNRVSILRVLFHTLHMLDFTLIQLLILPRIILPHHQSQHDERSLKAPRHSERKFINRSILSPESL